tara:strand:- start:620 stop:1168 length:549 start_codon:yes stop_codon:yes gene_type:complete
MSEFFFGLKQPPNILIGTDHPSIDEANDSYTVVDLMTTTINSQSAARTRAITIADLTPDDTKYIGVKWLTAGGITTVNWYLATNGIFALSPDFTETKGVGLQTFKGVTSSESIAHGLGVIPDIFLCHVNGRTIYDFDRANGTDGGRKIAGLEASTTTISIRLNGINPATIVGDRTFTAIKFS